MIYSFFLFSLVRSISTTSMPIEKAVFGGGCFWGMEKWFQKEFLNLEATSVGYLGGNKANPTYQEVCTGKTGHAEVIQVEFDPAKVSYERLVHFFFKIHDPTTKDSQGPDKGSQYRSMIAYHSDEQKKVAEAKVKELSANPKFQALFNNRPIVTEIIEATTYYPAEDYHQDYLIKNPGGYCTHRPRDWEK